MADEIQEPGWSPTLDDGELEELDQFLRAHAGEDALLLDGVHGLLSAVNIGPERPPPEEWLPEVLHDPFDGADEGRRILELLARLSESIGYELETEQYEPILGEIELDDGGNALSAQGWCEGFSRGVDLRARLWESRLGADSRLTELLSPIMALAVQEGVFQTDAEIEPLTEAEYDECLAQLPGAIEAVARYWSELPPTPAELAHRAEPADPATPPRKRGGHWLH
ncbi:MAG TPA: YecA family protein [Rudaea sp.]|nr:YecA family protein [Rudaea sp.]